MLVTLDTNVLFMALYSSKGASHQILELIRHSEAQLALSVPVLKEYEDVLLRPSSLQTLDVEVSEVVDFLDALVLLAFPFDIHYLMRPNLRDENDNMFVDLAFASSSEFLVTSNLRDFSLSAELKFDSFKLVTPAAFISNWRNRNG